ncbi:MAG: hypothetical protein ACRDCZ_07920 [Culicoidibacterales bacterium]
MKQSEKLFFAKLSAQVGSLLLLGKVLLLLLLNGMTLISQQLWGGYDWPMPMRMGWDSIQSVEPVSSTMMPMMDALYPQGQPWMNSSMMYPFGGLSYQIIVFVLLILGVVLAVWLLNQAQQLSKQPSKNEQWYFLVAAIILVLMQQLLVASLLFIAGVLIAWYRQQIVEEQDGVDGESHR